MIYEKSDIFYGKRKRKLRKITYRRWNEKVIEKKIKLCCFAKILSNLTFMQGRKKIIIYNNNII